MLESLVIDARGRHRATVVWLHGLGADGHDFEPIVPELGLPDALGLRFIFPHAPVRPVTINAGTPVRAWYDIFGLDPDAGEDAEGIAASVTEVERLLAAENDAGIDAGHMVLAGFSQGGAIALHTGLRHRSRLAGVMGLSTYLPLRERLDEAAPANRDTPIFMAHGSADPVLPYSWGEASRDRLCQAGYNVAWHSYPMQHQLCLEEVRAIGAWLQRVLGERN